MILLFNDRGWQVTTSAWTVAAKSNRFVQVCYVWGADGFSFAESATGVSSVTLNITMDQFLERIEQNNHYIDCRDIS